MFLCDLLLKALEPRPVIERLRTDSRFIRIGFLYARMRRGKVVFFIRRRGGGEGGGIILSATAESIQMKTKWLSEALCPRGWLRVSWLRQSSSPHLILNGARIALHQRLPSASALHLPLRAPPPAHIPLLLLLLRAGMRVRNRSVPVTSLPASKGNAAV